jgi:hypothetical protein
MVEHVDEVEPPGGNREDSAAEGWSDGLPYQRLLPAVDRKFRLRYRELATAGYFIEVAEVTALVYVIERLGLPTTYGMGAESLADLVLGPQPPSPQLTPVSDRLGGMAAIAGLTTAQVVVAHLVAAVEGLKLLEAAA